MLRPLQVHLLGHPWPSYIYVFTVMVLCDLDIILRHYGFTAPAFVSTLAFLLHVSLHLISHGSILASPFSGLLYFYSNLKGPVVLSVHWVTLVIRAFSMLQL